MRVSNWLHRSANKLSSIELAERLGKCGSSDSNKTRTADEVIIIKIMSDLQNRLKHPLIAQKKYLQMSLLGWLHHSRGEWLRNKFNPKYVQQIHHWIHHRKAIPSHLLTPMDRNTISLSYSRVRRAENSRCELQLCSRNVRGAMILTFHLR